MQGVNSTKKALEGKLNEAELSESMPATALSEERKVMTDRKGDLGFSEPLFFLFISRFFLFQHNPSLFFKIITNLHLVIARFCNQMTALSTFCVKVGYIYIHIIYYYPLVKGKGKPPWDLPLFFPLAYTELSGVKGAS